MKAPSLPAAFLAATLFLATGLQAQAPAEGMMRPGKADDMLKRFDRNGDGRIDEDERLTAREAMLTEENNRQSGRLTAVPGGPEQYRARLMELFDQDRDGRLDETERQAARRYAEERGIAESGEVREYVFRRHDKNGDGLLDPAERAALQAFQEGRAQVFAEFREDFLTRVDVNRDGRIGPTEMALFEDFFHRRIDADPAAFPGADLNGNGRLDFVEWLDIREQLRRVLAVERARITPQQQDLLDRQFELRLRLREDRRKREAVAPPAK